MPPKRPEKNHMYLPPPESVAILRRFLDARVSRPGRVSDSGKIDDVLEQHHADRT